MSRRLTIPERILQELWVERPQEIDIEAIAWELGARVRVRELHSCEARIVGRGDKAIITVDSRIGVRRQRFSIAHELGHWHHHRGRCLLCRAEEIGDRRRQATDPERVADDYASDMLVPRYLLEPILRDVPRPSVKAIREIAGMFDASLTATAIKIAEVDRYPLIIVNHGLKGRRWFRRSPSVPTRWFPKEDLDPESYVFEMLFGNGEEQAFQRRIGADAWFDRADADRYELLEQSYRVSNDQVITVLQLTDPGMLQERISNGSSR